MTDSPAGAGPNSIGIDTRPHRFCSYSCISINTRPSLAFPTPGPSGLLKPALLDRSPRGQSFPADSSAAPGAGLPLQPPQLPRPRTRPQSPEQQRYSGRGQRSICAPQPPSRSPPLPRGRSRPQPPPRRRREPAGAVRPGAKAVERGRPLDPRDRRPGQDGRIWCQHPGTWWGRGAPRLFRGYSVAIRRDGRAKAPGLIWPLRLNLRPALCIGHPSRPVPRRGAR